MGNKVIIFSAPSGAGKSTVVNHLLGLYPELEFSISATSRAPRGQEKHGVEYYFYTSDEFRSMIAEDKFVEYEEVYAGSFYGTLRSEVERIWAKGHAIVFDIDVQGGVNLKKIFGEQALSIFIQAPSVDILRTRLVGRGTDTEEAIERRVAKAASEMEFAAGKFDYTLINDDLQTALTEAENVVKGFLSKSQMNIAIYSGSFNPLHIGHLAIIKYMIEEAGFDMVYLIVSPKNPLKEGISSATGLDRYNAAVAAVGRRSLSQVRVDDIELNMPEPHYTVRTLRALKEREPENSFTFVMGADNLADIRRWREHTAILKDFGVAVFPRIGHDLTEIKQDLLKEDPAYKIQILDAPLVNISSTEIREAISKGEDISALLM